MPIRITGMNSGLDTESIITALTQTKQDKLNTAKGDQKKLTWKQDKWKELNKKVTSFYNGALSNMRFTSAYNKKTTTVSNANAASVITGEGAMNATQTLDIIQLAKSGYLTGQEVKVGTSKATKETTAEELGLSTGDKIKFSIGGNTSDVLSVTVEEGDTVGSILSKLKSATSSETGTSLNFNYDENNGRFYVSSKTAGEAASFDLIIDSESSDAMTKLGLTKKADGSNYISGTSAEIVLNGETYTSDTNTFEINGLTITANEVASGITLSTKQDTSGIYDNIKNMIKEYNDLMKEFATLYNADKASKYKMLTDDQKKEMSDTEVEEWEKKIKDGLLSHDETIGTIKTALREMMNSSFDVTLKDGTTKSLSLASFGISTGGYFETEENERDLLHIDGDEDDSSVSGNTDLLRSMISTDPTAVQDFFTELSKSIYSKLSDLMKGTEYSSSFTIYEDKLMASQYSAYNTKISDAQSALEAAQDKLYKKFATMETALSKINSSSNSLSGFFGGN
ncbi:flagellar hook-associated protein 2 [Butyrivibrio sp. INlla18]|uniref:flagellar filament capping protein FliD n=1 Tax=Butyrivibrio sp. INlla18 TaxID=1520806 RepID=UPI000886DD30|nr:flagellar filament capping protein FliD [Butyrivibrio sp. INlla18]SDA42006.1 flagellar hook-associated protein 2 [Butyrivibrio sp. INlla18]